MEGASYYFGLFKKDPMSFLINRVGPSDINVESKLWHAETKLWCDEFEKWRPVAHDFVDVMDRVTKDQTARDFLAVLERRITENSCLSKDPMSSMINLVGPSEAIVESKLWRTESKLWRAEVEKCRPVAINLVKVLDRVTKDGTDRDFLDVLGRMVECDGGGPIWDLHHAWFRKFCFNSVHNIYGSWSSPDPRRRP